MYVWKKTISRLLSIFAKEINLFYEYFMWSVYKMEMISGKYQLCILPAFGQNRKWVICPCWCWVMIVLKGCSIRQASDWTAIKNFVASQVRSQMKGRHCNFIKSHVKYLSGFVTSIVRIYVICGHPSSSDAQW